jgi:heterodisulfide reductase subunit B
MTYAYYPGCSLHSTGKEYDASFRAVCRRLGIELVEVKDWVCCGTTAAHALSWRLALALPLKNLAEAEKQGLTELLAPCASCFSRFKFALHEIEKKPQLREEMEDVVEHKFGEGVKVIHPLEVFSSQDWLGRLASLGGGKLRGLKVVCYYGCLLTRPPEVTRFDNCENPQSMDRVLGALGASVLDWGCKTDCCGASHSLTRTDIVRKLSHDILEGAREAGAEAVAVACPLCHLNLDTRQKEIEREFGTSYNLPVFYFTQLVGIALGVPARRLLLDRHFVDTRAALEKVGVR